MSHALARLALAGATAAVLALCALPAAAQVTWDGDDGADREQVERVRARKRCPEGQVITSDTQGQCCWPGQAWNGQRCVGVPTSCPDALRADATQQACISGHCREHQVVMGDGEHCCWPGQAWSAEREACLGTPVCPVDYVVDAEDCRYVAPDTDGDGLDDLADTCPFRPEDTDAFQDDDGCPDLDNDADGFADAIDRCPVAAEDLDGFADDDGCPDLDNDADGVLDDVDQCAAVAEDLDGFADDDGCPDLDNDGDGLADLDDRCPLAGEELNGYEDADGCPDEGRKLSRTLEIAGWSTVAVGLALGGTSLGLHLWAESERDRVRSPTSLDPHGGNLEVTQREAASIEETANTLDTVAAASLGVGGVAVAAGTALVILAYIDRGEQMPMADVSASLGRDGAMFFYQLAF